MLKIVWDDDTVPAMKRERNLPAVLSRDEINAIIDATPNLKHKAIIATMPTDTSVLIPWQFAPLASREEDTVAYTLL